jgi:hypothetical protein
VQIFMSTASLLAKMHIQWWWWPYGTLVVCSWIRALSNSVIVHPLSVVVSMERSKRHYF